MGPSGMVVTPLSPLPLPKIGSGLPKRTASPAESGVGPSLPENLFIGVVVV